MLVLEGNSRIVGEVLRLYFSIDPQHYFAAVHEIEVHSSNLRFLRMVFQFY